MVEGHGKRDDPGSGDAAKGGLEADDAAQRRGDANGTARVGADACVTEAGRDGRGGAPKCGLLVVTP